MPNEVLYVKLLGNFEVKNSHGILNRETLHSDKLLRLLSYILIFRKKDLTVQELCDALWPIGTSGNPAGALKNLMYRLRGSMKILGEDDFILTRRGFYCWNQDIEVHADFEKFDELSRKAVDVSKTEDEKVTAAQLAVKIYHGTLPSKVASEQWGLPLETYFHSCYLDTVKFLSDYYENRQLYEQMEDLCSEALTYDGLDEQLHCSLIKALIMQGKKNLALAHYHRAEKQLYESLGMRGSLKLQSVYENLLSMKNNQYGNMEEIRRDILESRNPDSVFMCEYTIFKEIYRLENRRLDRLGITEYIILLSLKREEKEAQEQTWEYLTKRSMEKLENVLRSQLRRGDAAARYSDSQFIVLLPTCTETTAQMVADRISSAFLEVNKNKRLILTCEIQEVSSSSSVNVDEMLKNS